MIEAILEYYIYNRELYSTKEIGYFDKISNPMIYEVIRVIEGQPLFLEEHLERMEKSAKLIDFNLNKSKEEISNEVYKLIDKNNCNNMNIKFLCSNLDKDNQDFFLYFIKSYYPEEHLYKKGIHTISYYSERKNPNAKVVNIKLREKISQKLKEENAFEALLVNNEGLITEGSRSNMFFVKDNKLYTAPAKDVLLGVTRNKIMDICKKLNIEVIEESIKKSDIYNLEGAFMTSTSVNVIPIKSIDDILINSLENPIIKKIGKAYEEEMKNYINARKEFKIK
ncbi:aminotransferase class IV [Tepidibacter formicigenes]|jgi:branched-chain amino acid aminotransferase|uniref:Branched-chain amino acid aminotransferase n=1 Tax=Tepidibacter formicigenes DSM 15518 TaxID=1123349 RepID=A0A1M6PEX9_9FIRM|nr:aminotransferase class IV [Tepidibacter formicigenes]SHK06518.1 branched-chain amino acid aminotransferase [Tepidibacter formicigenes DSM 15518]